MSTITHKIITATSEIPGEISALHQKAVEIFGNSVSSIADGTVNGSKTFVIATSGSKDGWDDAVEHDNKIIEFSGHVYRSAFIGEVMVIRYNRDTDNPSAYLMRTYLD